MPLDAAPQGSRLHVRRCAATADRRAFLAVPYLVHAGDPAFRPPLRFERAAHLKRHLNGEEATRDHALFVAERDGLLAGRVIAFRNQAHLDRYGDGAGHWGMLEADAPDAVAPLLRAAEDHLRGLGAAYAQGPYELSVNEMLGLPETGTDTPNMLMMPHAQAWLADAVEAAGYETATRLLAYVVDLDANYPRPPTVQKIIKIAQDEPRVRLRQMDPDRFGEEVRMAMGIFNDAWSGNWGFLPFTEEQVEHMAKELRPLLTPDTFWIAELDGEPAAFVVMTPNVNEAARDLDGRLAPFGWAKLLWRLKGHKITTSRMMLMGIRREHHKKRLGVAMICALFEEVFAAQRARGIKTCEMSWVLETNRDVRRLIELSGAEVYKTYRLVRKAL